MPGHQACEGDRKKHVDLGKIMNIDVENMGKNNKLNKKVHPQKKRDMSQLANFEI